MKAVARHSFALRKNGSQLCQSVQICRSFATAFDPNKFSKRFDTDTEEIENYYKHAEKEAWKQYKHKPLKNPNSKSSNFVVSGKGYRQIVLGDKVVRHEMVKWLAPNLWILRELQDVYGVIVRGGGEAGKMKLPIGADYKGLLSSSDTIYPYFRDWYRLVYQYSRFHRPLVSCMSGHISECMAGLLVHTPYRIAFEDSVYSLPQTGQGFFPDSGLTYFLPRLDGSLGMYLALTGKKLYGSDLVHAGIATQYMKNNAMPQLVNHFEENSGDASVIPNIMEFHDRIEIAGSPFSLEPYLDIIDTCFSQETVEGMAVELNKAAESDPSCSDFVQETLGLLFSKSPLSLKVTCEALRQGAKQSLPACLKMEYTLANVFVYTADFKEGCKAIFEKRSPTWEHTSLQKVTSEDALSYFKKHDESQRGSKVTQIEELSLPILDYSPDAVRQPKWDQGELFNAESLDPEAAELTKKSLESFQKQMESKDITDQRWFEFRKKNGTK